MDSLFILALFLSNPVVNEFSSTLNVAECANMISKERVTYLDSLALRADNLCIQVKTSDVCGSILISSSADNKGHLVFFKTQDSTLWNYIQSYVIANVSFVQAMNQRVRDDSSPTFFGLPKYFYNKMIYKINIVRSHNSNLNTDETQVFIKIKNP